MKKLSFSFLLFMIFTPVLFSQGLSELRLSDKGKIVPEELIDKNIRDANGEICAGLMVISDLEGMFYTSYNQIVKINRLPEKDLLFISEDERVVEIYKTGYKPLKLILNELGIRLAKGQVWKITITGDKKMELIPVNIVTDQKGVKIIIDQTERDAFKPQMLASGEHRIVIEKDGFMPVDSIINVSTANNLFNFRLTEIDFMPVMLKSIPAGARIVIDNAEKGETDKGLFLLPGKHKLRLTMPGYLDVEQIIDVVNPVKNEFTFSLSKNEAILKLAVEPADSKILINKEDFSGRKEIKLNLGKYKIEISKPGYSTLTETFELNPDDAVTKNYRLTAKTGGFLFSSVPADVSAALTKQEGGIKYEWEGMKAFKDLQTGEYTLVLKLKGYKTLRKNISIEEGITKREEIKLEQLKPGETDTDAKDSNPELNADSSGGGIAWYYYAGAAVAGGVAAVLTLLKPKEAVAGSASSITVVPSRPTGN